MESSLFKSFNKIVARNKYGRVNLYRQGNKFYIQRHEGNVPPQEINYRAYIQALAGQGVKKIISVNSVGSLKRSVKPGSLLVPHDFISLWRIPTFFDKEIKHFSAGIDEDLRNLLYKAAKRADLPIIGSGIYFQTTGPRFETPSEIKMLAKFADVVGMTLGSEATLAAEKGIALASLCAVDNYANGLAGKVDYDKIKSMAARSRDRIEKILASALNI